MERKEECVYLNTRQQQNAKEKEREILARSSSRTYFSLKVQKKDSKKEGDDMDSV